MKRTLKIWTEKDIQLFLLKTLFKPWADSKGIIRRAWVFGSRIKGNYRNDSDLDIAIQILADSEIIINATLWEKELKDLFEISFEINICLFAGKQETPTVAKGLKEGSIKIYEYVLPSGLEDTGSTLTP